MRRTRLLAGVCGMVLWAAVALAEVFTLAVLPDTQNEAWDSTQFVSRLQWLIDQKEELKLKMVLQVGDLQNWDTPDHDQFVRMSERLKMLNRAGIPYALTLGNHDTAAVKEGGSAAPGNVNANLRVTTTFNRYYPATSFANLAGVMEEGKIDNAFHTFEAGGMKWLVLNVELWPRTQAVAWAKSVAETHPDHNIIVLTHSFLNHKGEIEQRNGGYGDTSPQYLFDEVIKPSSNVKLVFSGHTGGGALRTEPTTGGTVYCFLQCYHSKTNPVRLVEIDTEAGAIRSRVYCPMTDENLADGNVSLEDVKWVMPAK